MRRGAAVPAAFLRRRPDLPTIAYRVWRVAGRRAAVPPQQECDGLVANDTPVWAPAIRLLHQSLEVSQLRPICLPVALLLLLALATAAFAADPAPRLDASSLRPSTGTTSTMFLFNIIYYGPNPTEHRIYIDNDYHEMTFARTSGGGTVYEYKTKLAQGTHRYRFTFQSGGTTLNRPKEDPTVWTPGPTVTASPNYSLSGRIRVGTVGLGGCVVRLTRGGIQNDMVTTNPDGCYVFRDLEAGPYVVTPTKCGYAMTPAPKNVTLTGTITNCDFTAARK